MNTAAWFLGQAHTTCGTAPGVRRYSHAVAAAGISRQQAREWRALRGRQGLTQSTKTAMQKEYCDNASRYASSTVPRMKGS